MKTQWIPFIAAILLLSLFFPADIHAKAPPWVVSRPISRDYYIGIAACNKKETPNDCRKVAENKALFELSSEISVDISGAFVEKIVERTGLSEQDVRMEVRAASNARLTGHEMVAHWEDGKEYWVYFRLSKETYHRIMNKEREAAVAAAVDMTTRALDAAKAENTVSALRFYFEALARVQDFIGENIQVAIQGRSTFLFNEIYAGIQNTLAEMRLNAGRKSVPALMGAPQQEPFSATATRIKDTGESAEIAGLPLRFDFPWKGDEAFRRAATDNRGTAGVTLATVTAADDGQTVTARVDVDSLRPQKDTRGFFLAMIQKLSIPETGMVIHVFEDRDTYHWHREFEGKDILIASACQTTESVGPWPKIHDELLNFIQGIGGRPQRLATHFDLKHLVRISKEPGTAGPAGILPDADLIVIAVADGKFNQRENAKNPFGEDIQFAGEIRTLAFQQGKAYFSDRYKGATGWNPMGADMSLDVLALHVFKRWQAKYLQHLQADSP